MDTDILIIGAGPAGLAVGGDAEAEGPPAARDREGGAGRLVVAQPLRAPASAHGEGVVGAARPAVSRRPAALRAAPGRRRLPRRVCGARRHRAVLRRGSDDDRPRRGRALAHDDALRQDLRLERRRRHDRRQQPSVRAGDRGRRGIPDDGPDRAQPRLPRRGAVRRRARARRRHGQHRRRDRARPRRARRRRRALGALADQRRPPRGSRPADAADLDIAVSAAGRARRRAGALLLRRHGRRHLSLGAAALARVAAAPAARAGPHAGDRRRHAGAHRVGRDRRLPGAAPPRRRRCRVRRRAHGAIRRDRAGDRLPGRRRRAVPGRRRAGRRERTADASSPAAASSRASISSASTCARRAACCARSRSRPSPSPSGSARRRCRRAPAGS